MEPVDTLVDIVYKDGCRPTDDPAPLPDVVFVRFAGYKSPPFINEDPRLSDIQAACASSLIVVQMAAAPV